MRTQHSPFKKPQFQPTTVQPKMHNHAPPKGYCFKFNWGVEYAAGCNFKHQRFNCDGLHQASRCNFRAHSRPSTKQPQPSKPLPPAKSKPTPSYFTNPWAGWSLRVSSFWVTAIPWQNFCQRVLERGFHCIMKVLESRLMPPIYFPSWTTQRWSMPNLTRNARLAVWLALFITFPFIYLEFLP